VFEVLKEPEKGNPFWILKTVAMLGHNCVLDRLDHLLNIGGNSGRLLPPLLLPTKRVIGADSQSY